MLSSDEEGVRAELQDGVGIWTIDRPARQNSLAEATLRRLLALAEAAGQSRTLRAVVITGQGDNVFSAGADLKERKTMPLDRVRALLTLFGDCFDAIDALDKPVIAAINGVAFGGGLELALACDLRVMAGSARVGLVETQLGIIPGAGGTQRLVRTIGLARAKQMVLLAERIDAQEALRIGLVNRVASGGEGALGLALEWAETLAQGAPIALAAALAALDAAGDDDLRAGLAIERACYERTLVSSDRNEGLQAFLEKREPKFTGE